MIPVSLPTPPPTALTPADAAPTPERAQEVAEEFASLFIGQMLQAMRKSAHVGGAPSLGTQTFEAMMDEEVARAIARSHDLGLAQIISDDFSQEI